MHIIPLQQCTADMAATVGGKALGLGEDAIVALQKADWRRSLGEVTGDDLREAGLDPAAMGEPDHRRAEDVLVFAHNLEHAADVVDRNLMAVAAKRLKRGLDFAPADQETLLALVDRLQTNLHAAGAVFMTEDVRAARALAAEKEVFRDAEDAATQAHFVRLRTGNTDRAEAGALHLDVLRDLKQVNAHLVAAAAYPVLKTQGELLPSRLREPG